MIPEPSKRPFGFPLPDTALEHLVHPVPRASWHLPFRDAEGNVITYNGALAVRIRSYLDPDLECSPVPWEEVNAGIGIEFPPESSGKEDKGLWRPLDEAAGLIWRYGPKPVWYPYGREVSPNKATPVRVGVAIAAPLCLIQLAARLPRCRVWTANRPEEPMWFRFNGGEAIIRYLQDLPRPSFGILSPRRDPAQDARF